VIWNALLPHRGGRNGGASPRITQYVSMQPASSFTVKGAERVELWKQTRVPEHWRSFLPTVIDPEPRAPAELSELGRKLLGLDAWDG